MLERRVVCFSLRARELIRWLVDLQLQKTISHWAASACSIPVPASQSWAYLRPIISASDESLTALRGVVWYLYIFKIQRPVVSLQTSTVFKLLAKHFSLIWPICTDPQHSKATPNKAHPSCTNPSLPKPQPASWNVDHGWRPGGLVSSTPFLPPVGSDGLYGRRSWWADQRSNGVLFFSPPTHWKALLYPAQTPLAYSDFSDNVSVLAQPCSNVSAVPEKSEREYCSVPERLPAMHS